MHGVQHGQQDTMQLDTGKQPQQGKLEGNCVQFESECVYLFDLPDKTTESLGMQYCPYCCGSLTLLPRAQYNQNEIQQSDL